MNRTKFYAPPAMLIANNYVPAVTDCGNRQTLLSVADFNWHCSIEHKKSNILVDFVGFVNIVEFFLLEGEKGIEKKNLLEVHPTRNEF